MKQFTQWIASKSIKDYKKTNNLKVRARYGLLEGWVSIVGNSLLFIIKIILGLSIQSVALITDAIHTLTDSATSVVVIIGFKMAKKPSDKEHPFGHGNMEAVAGLIVAVLLLLTGFELLKKSIHTIIHPQASIASYGLIAIVFATAIIKELMARFSFALSDCIDSKALKADAVHHRTDVLTTLLVVIALIVSRYGFTQIDGIMGLFVSIFIGYSGYAIAKEAVNPLLGEAPSKETLLKIAELASKRPGVLGVHDIIYNKYGQTSIISFHIEVPDNESVNKLHILSEEVEDDIAEAFGGMVVVHIDPINKDHPQYEEAARTISEIISEDARIHSFHELRIIGSRRDKCKVIFDIVLAEEADEQETYDIVRMTKEKFQAKFPHMKIMIKPEPKYAYTV